jgi:hypothetical protein
LFQKCRPRRYCFCASNSWTNRLALTRFDGHGNMTHIDHVLHNGVLPMEAWRPGDGPYQVNPDCTCWFTITPKPTDPADGSPDLKLYFVIGDEGREIRTVVSGSPTATAFSAAITSIGRRFRDSSAN